LYEGKKRGGKNTEASGKTKKERGVPIRIKKRGGKSVFL